MDDCFCLVSKSCLTFSDTMDCGMPGFPVLHWSGLPFPSPGDLPNPGIEPRSQALQEDFFFFFFFYHLSHCGSPYFKMLNLLTCQKCVVCNYTYDEYFYLQIQNM